MTSKRNHVADLPSSDAGASASAGPPEQMLDEALKRAEQEPGKRDKGRQDLTAPRAGRTGGLGSRAERPSEGRQPTEQPASGPRGGKPPAPRACSEK